MRVLFDAPSYTGSHPEWASVVNSVAQNAVKSSSGIESELFCTTDPESTSDIAIAQISFPRRQQSFPYRAAEAELLTKVAKSWDIDVFLSTGESYVLDIPSVVVRLDSDANDRSLSVATALGTQFVVLTEQRARRLQRVYPFIRDDMIHVPLDPDNIGEVGLVVARAIDRALSASASDWRDVAARRLLEDYQSLAVKIQV